MEVGEDYLIEEIAFFKRKKAREVFLALRKARQDIILSQRNKVSPCFGKLILSHASRTETGALAVHADPITALSLLQRYIIEVFEAKAAVGLHAAPIHLIFRWI
mmetsp:Transcript_14884/g.10787  ORF Transcript_14884/g.10787 Transcript_14884/m.10787 type:complete len:104 (-) Transcript_14884:61-372(-)